MKKTYEAPSIEKIAFQYRNQVVAASGTICESKWVDEGMDSCTSGEQHLEYLK